MHFLTLSLFFVSFLYASFFLDGAQVLMRLTILEVHQVNMYALLQLTNWVFHFLIVLVRL